MSTPLVLLSNRGPANFERTDSGEIVASRGGGGLVTALTGVLRHRDALWIASAMKDEDIEVSQSHGGGSFEVDLDGTTYKLRLVTSDPEAYDRFYNVIANPMLWFIQHYLWDLSNVPDVRTEDIVAWDEGYKRVNDDMAQAALQEIEGLSNPIVMSHDYHLYTCPFEIRRERPDAMLQQFVHIPWTQPDAWRVLPTRIRNEIFEGLLANDIVGFHTHLLLQQLHPMLPRTDGARDRLRARRRDLAERARDLGAPLSTSDRRGRLRARLRAAKALPATSGRSCAGGAST